MAGNDYIPYLDLDDFQTRLVNSESTIDRIKAAEYGFGLDQLVSDPDAGVRKAVAQNGFGLDLLAFDDNKGVAEQANRAIQRDLGTDSGIGYLMPWVLQNPSRCANPEMIDNYLRGITFDQKPDFYEALSRNDFTDTSSLSFIAKEAIPFAGNDPKAQKTILNLMGNLATPQEVRDQIDDLINKGEISDGRTPEERAEDHMEARDLLDKFLGPEGKAEEKKTHPVSLADRAAAAKDLSDGLDQGGLTTPTGRGER